MDAGVVYYVDTTVELMDTDPPFQMGMIRQQVQDGKEVMIRPSMIHEGVIHHPCYTVTQDLVIPHFGTVRVHMHVSQADDHVTLEDAPDQMKNGYYFIHRN